jgi:hypothetical protein
MRYASFLVFILMIVLIGCSNGANLPVTPSEESDNPGSDEKSAVDSSEASDVLYAHDSDGLIGYKAFGVFRVVFDPDTLTAEITPSRKSHAIGTTFDADLTQFLTKSPCYNCLRINGVQMVGTDQVQIGFALKHPFGDITKRPDLHGFDVRGIVIADKNWESVSTMIATGEITTENATANVSMVLNPDGYTSHFDTLAEDTNYFNPPLDYDAAINPYKRFFEDAATGAFDPNNPAGYNVLPVGSDWETVNYIFNVPTGGSMLDFVFVVDCAYGQSATFQNRTNPYYFLPEFNRKEAWKVTTTPSSGRFYAGNSSSSMSFDVSICDWQAGLAADPAYPNTTNLGGIKEKSDVKKVSIEIPGVSGLVEVTTASSGDGSNTNPYIYNLTVTNSSSAPAGNYYGITAVRDDLYQTRGPIGIPATPAGFPFPGPEIWDYSTYNIFQVRVFGSAPTLASSSYPTYVNEGEFVNFYIDTSEPDGDQVTYSWEQLTPPSPDGNFIDPSVEDAVWQAPPLDDEPSGMVQFDIRLTMSDADGQNPYNFSVTVYEINSPPVCEEIISDPYYGVLNPSQPVDIQLSTFDPDGDVLTYEWDLDWDGNISNFNVDATGSYVPGHYWNIPGFYKVGCRITEQRTNPLVTVCSRDFIVQGIRQGQKIDNSSDFDPGYYDQDVFMMRDFTSERPVYHVTYIDMDDGAIVYCNNLDNPDQFGNHQTIYSGAAIGSLSFARITGTNPFVNIVWLEYIPSGTPADYVIKMARSSDGGRTFDSPVSIMSADLPNSIAGVDICPGVDPGVLYLLLTEVAGGSGRCGVWYSNDVGNHWNQPFGGGYFRDSGLNGTDYPSIEVSSNLVIHTFWYDTRTSPYLYYYDWSSDGGMNWHTDTVISETPIPRDGAFDVDDNGNAYFVWTDGIGRAYSRKTTYGDPVVLGSVSEFFNLGSDNFRGIDIWVSPEGRSVVVPLIVYNTFSTNYNSYYFYSDTYGSTFDIFTWEIYSVQMDHPVCDGRFEENPNRIEVLTTWIDSRVSLAPFNDHIWGNFLYIAEPF